MIALNKFAFQVTMTDTSMKMHNAHTSEGLAEKDSAGTTQIQPALPKIDVQTLCQVYIYISICVCVCVCVSVCVCVCVCMLLLTCF